MPTTRYYPKVTKASLYAFVSDLARFLVNDLGGYTGPGWTIVEAYSSTAGTKYRTPTVGDEGNMDNAAFAAGSDFGWQTGSVTATDWIVLESAAGVYGTTFQVLFRLTSTTNLNILMFPLANFSTGSGTTPPTYPSPSIGNGSANPVSFTGFSGSASYSIVADEAMCSILADNSTTPYWIYFGELDGAASAGTPADDRPFVIWKNSYNVYMAPGANFCRVSPVDDSTVLTSGYNCAFNGPAVIHNTGYDAALLGLYSVLPVAVYFDDTSHKHFAGFLRNIGEASAALATAGTLNSKEWMYRTSSATAVRLVTKWDTVTDYP